MNICVQITMQCVLCMLRHCVCVYCVRVVCVSVLLLCVCVCVRVETGSGHPGHVFAGSSGSDPLYKISGSDPDSARAILMVSGGDELSMPEGDDITISPQDISRRVTIHRY